jgi:O-antigen ligase
MFVCFLGLAFVGLKPFPETIPQTLQTIGTGEGDIGRQIAYLVMLAASAIPLLRKRGVRVLAAIPVSLTILLGWCLLSASWALDPTVAFRRVVLSAAVVVTVAFNVEHLGVARTLRALRIVLAGILIINLASVFVVTQAIHLPGEGPDALVGNWRGLHAHKNTAGAVAALSVLIFLFVAQETRRYRDWILCVAAAGFLWMTQAKTSITLVAVAAISGCVYRYGWRWQAARQVTMWVSVLVLALLGYELLYNQARILALVDDPELLTGRGALWQVLMAAAHDHPIGGVGFGSLWNVGAITPATEYGNAWVALQVQGHNGYLDVLAQTGSIGLLLLLLILVVIPVKRFVGRDARPTRLQALMFSILVFAIFFNVTETSFLQRDRPEWIVFLIVITVLEQRSCTPQPRAREMRVAA